MEQMVNNVISNLQSNTIPVEVIKKFIYSLFENGSIQVGKYRIVSWNDNDRHAENKKWDKSQFEKYGLLSKVETENGDIFHEINHQLGAQIWRTVVKEINNIQICEKPVKKEVNTLLRYQNISLQDLINKRESLENERKQIMRSVAIAQINNKGHHTAVKVKEGYAERLISIIENIDMEIEFKISLDRLGNNEYY